MAKVMTIWPPDELHEKLKSTAKKYGYTLTKLVLRILWDWLKNEKRSEDKQ